MPGAALAGAAGHVETWLLTAIDTWKGMPT